MTDLFGYWTLHEQAMYNANVGGFHVMVVNDTLSFNGTHAYYTYTVVQGEPLIFALMLFIAVCIGIKTMLQLYYYVKGDAK